MNFITCMWTSSYSSIIVEDTISPLIVGVLSLLKVTIFMYFWPFCGALLVCLLIYFPVAHCPVGCSF